MIKNYIFDFGNVLGQFYPERFAGLYTSGKAAIKIISEVVFDRIYWDRLDEGAITDAQVKESFCARLPENLREVACTIYDNWVKDLIPVPGMENLISDLHKANKKIYLLSNISEKFITTYHDVEWIDKLFSCFDGLVLSGEIGIAKPSTEIFKYLLTKYNLDAEECLFIDDLAKNIQGAQSVGINGYLFDGDAEKLRKYIQL